MSYNLSQDSEQFPWDDILTPKEGEGFDIDMDFDDFLDLASSGGSDGMLLMPDPAPAMEKSYVIPLYIFHWEI